MAYINSGDLLSLKVEPPLVQKFGISAQFMHSHLAIVVTPSLCKNVINGQRLRSSAETLLEVARPQTPRRRDRLLQRVAHLEPETAASPCLLRCRHGLDFARPDALDSMLRRREPFRLFISVSFFLPDRDV